MVRPQTCVVVCGLVGSDGRQLVVERPMTDDEYEQWKRDRAEREKENT